MDMENTRKGKRRRESVKVVYISSPVKVKTSASRFRALVQELTGRESDVSRFVETNGVTHNSPTFFDDDHRVSSEMEPNRESPTSSGSLFEPDYPLIGRAYAQEMFQPNISFFEASELDVLGGYCAV